MAVSAGARLGPYQILSLIGTGGMGEVYKARDTRLDRLVAIKVLNADGAERPDRRARFETEARAVSALSHPHICSLFDVGDHEGRAYLVMEYLEGETLDDRLTRGPLPAADVLRYGAEIADALDHAHRKQVIHRDVKPSNVMLTAAGVKLLDFGLAKGPLLVAATPTSTASLDQGKLTAEGTMIGTFQYMAPEQLEGKSVDGRTDIFALGSVLYEMATGRRAFEGDSQASLIACILTAQPPAISSVRAAIDANSSLAALEHVVERCLAKNPDERWQTARDVKLELEWIDQGKSSRRASVPTGRRLRWREAVAWSLALIAGVAAAIAVMTPSENARTESTQFIVSPPAGTTIPVAQSRTRIAISPDGRRLAIVAFSEGRQQIWIRSLDSVAAEPLPGTEGGISPFWSPDSRFVGFFSPGDGTLKKIALAGGPARTICAAQVDGVPTWGRDGTILFTKFLDGIFRVSADGGAPTRVTQVDKGRRELNHYWPEFLPDGQHFLYMATALEESGLRATPSVYIASLDSPEATLLDPSAFAHDLRRAGLSAVRRERRPAGPAFRHDQAAASWRANTDRRRNRVCPSRREWKFYGVDQRRAGVPERRRVNRKWCGPIGAETSPRRVGPGRTTAVFDSRPMASAWPSTWSIPAPGRPTSGSSTQLGERRSDSQPILRTRADQCGRRMVAAS